MIWLDWIIKIGGAVSIIIGVWRSVIALTRHLDSIKNDIKETKEYVMNNIKNVESIPIIEEHCRENHMTGLRLTIMNDNMPLGERIAAGIKYLKLNGNGEVKKFLVNELHINDIQKDLEEKL